VLKKAVIKLSSKDRENAIRSNIQYKARIVFYEKWNNPSINIAFNK
jgi:O-acetylhomoserine/O-acetylserine sulfhydrylase-like pyridoxal-dependent enzyme